MSSGKCPFCLGLNVLTKQDRHMFLLGQPNSWTNSNVGDREIVYKPIPVVSRNSLSSDAIASGICDIALEAVYVTSFIHAIL